jgi:type I restriction enzyme S subunit
MTALAAPRPAAGFAMSRRDLVGTRLDVNYARYRPTVADVISRSPFPMIPIRKIADQIQYGDSSKSVEEDNGAPILRMSNLQDGDWDLSVLKYTTLDEEDREKYLINPGDVLFNRTNSKELVGKCAVFREPGLWCFAGYLVRVHIADNDYMSEFLARFLNSDVGRVQIDQVSRQIIGMANINKDEIGGLLVPKPDPGIQKEMVEALENHWQKYQSRMKSVREMLVRGDDHIADRLALRAPQVDPVVGYGVTRAELMAGGRLNADFYSPERMLAIRAIEESKTPARRVLDVAEPVREFVDAPSEGDYYIGLANVERDTGEAIHAIEEELPTGSCVRFKEGDILYNKLRPYLNKVHIAERDGIASPEFLVFRPKLDEVRTEYLAAMLRSKLMLAQTTHMAGGNTHPRLTAEDVQTLLVPVPTDRKIQEVIADSEAASRSDARALREEAQRDWTAAKQHFGDSLIT